MMSWIYQNDLVRKMSARIKRLFSRSAKDQPIVNLLDRSVSIKQILDRDIQWSNKSTSAKD